MVGPIPNRRERILCILYTTRYRLHRKSLINEWMAVQSPWPIGFVGSWTNTKKTVPAMAAEMIIEAEQERKRESEADLLKAGTKDEVASRISMPRLRVDEAKVERQKVVEQEPEIEHGAKAKREAVEVGARPDIPMPVIIHQYSTVHQEVGHEAKEAEGRVGPGIISKTTHRRKMSRELAMKVTKKIRMTPQVWTQAEQPRMAIQRAKRMWVLGKRRAEKVVSGKRKISRPYSWWDSQMIYR